MTDIQVAFDPGSSLTKVVYRIAQRGQPKFLFMEPEAFELPRESVETKAQGRGGVGVNTAINDAWLTYNKKDEVAYVVGYLAQQFKAQMRLERSKFEAAVPKFLATIAAIASQENLDPAKLSVQAALLLPYGEFVNSSRLEDQIKSLGRSFYFRGEQIKAAFRYITIVPEGGGFIWELIDRCGKDWLVKQEAVCILMLGHRNTSLLTFTRGTLNTEKCRTTNQGFAALVDKAIERSSGQSRKELTRTIYEVGDDISPDHTLIRASTKTVNSANVAAEAENLAQAIQIARKEYWLLFKDWLQEVLPKRINKLIICGGGAFYLKSELSEYFSWTQPMWRNLESEQTQSLLAGWSDNSLSQRAADIWALFESLFKD